MRSTGLILGFCVSLFWAAPAGAASEDGLIAQAQKAEAAKDWAGAEAVLKQLTAMDPGRWDLAQQLGGVQVTLAKYADAVQSFDAGLTAAGADTQHVAAAKQAMAAMYVQQGNAYVKLRRDDDALAAYSKGAALSDDPATAYFDLCATFYNTGKTDQALGACDKVIAVDPKKADAYFIKGSVLMGNATIDAAGKATYPSGTVEALQMYLKLAPTGSHADDVKQMLDFIGGKPD